MGILRAHAKDTNRGLPAETGKSSTQDHLRQDRRTRRRTNPAGRGYVSAAGEINHAHSYDSFACRDLHGVLHREDGVLSLQGAPTKSRKEDQIAGPAPVAFKAGRAPAVAAAVPTVLTAVRTGRWFFYSDMAG